MDICFMPLPFEACYCFLLDKGNRYGCDRNSFLFFIHVIRSQLIPRSTISKNSDVFLSPLLKQSGISYLPFLLDIHDLKTLWLR